MRKVRSDKKRDVRPTVSVYIRNNLQALASIVGISLQDAAVTIIQNGLYSDDVLREFQPLMLSNFDIENRIYVGNRENTPIKINYRGQTAKVPVKFPADVYEDLRRLAFSIGLTPTTTAALVIRKAMFNETFMEKHHRLYLRHISDPRIENELDRYFKGLKKRPPWL